MFGVVKVWHAEITSCFPMRTVNCVMIFMATLHSYGGGGGGGGGTPERRSPLTEIFVVVVVG